MTESISFGLDLGMGALKLHGIQQSIQLISQVAVNNGPLVGRMLGLGSPRLPLRIALPSGSTFFVDSGAHDSGRPVENLSMDRFAGSPEMLALFYGAFTRLIQRSGDISQPVSITCGLPLDTLSGEEARTTVESIQRWMKADHIWKANDQENHLNVTEVRVTSQLAHHKLLPFLSMRLSGVNASLEKFFHILFCECFNGMFLKFGCCNFFCGIRELELHLQPAEK